MLSWRSCLSRRICFAGRIDALVPPGLTDFRQIAVAVPGSAEGGRIAIQQLTATLDAPVPPSGSGRASCLGDTDLQAVHDPRSERARDGDPRPADAGPVQVDPATAVGAAVPVVGVRVADMEEQVRDGDDDDGGDHVGPPVIRDSKGSDRCWACILSRRGGGSAKPADDLAHGQFLPVSLPCRISSDWPGSSQLVRGGGAIAGGTPTLMLSWVTSLTMTAFGPV